MASPGGLVPPRVGSFNKVNLPGESPWAKIVEIHPDGSWDGQIDNILIMTDYHGYSRGQMVRFQERRTPEYSIWVPQPETADV